MVEPPSGEVLIWTAANSLRASGQIPISPHNRHPSTSTRLKRSTLGKRHSICAHPAASIRQPLPSTPGQTYRCRITTTIPQAIPFSSPTMGTRRTRLARLDMCIIGRDDCRFDHHSMEQLRRPRHTRTNCHFWLGTASLLQVVLHSYRC